MNIWRWLNLTLFSLMVVNPIQAMIVRNKGEQAIAITNAASFSSVGIVGLKIFIEDKDIKSLEELYKSIKSTTPHEQKQIVEKALKEMFPESIVETIHKTILLNNMDLITFFDALILGQGVKIKDKLYKLEDFLKLIYEDYSLGLGGWGTGTVIDPESIGLDPKLYHNRVVFTAAHVVADEKGEYVFRLQPNLDNPNLAHYKEFKIQHIFIPKEYKHNKDGIASLSGHDFAVLILDHPVDLPITPIKVKTLNLKDLLGRTILTVGFGKTGYAGSDLVTDFIRRAGYFLINYVNPETHIYGATSFNLPQHFFYGADPFRHSQVFFGHPFKNQAEFTPFNYDSHLFTDLAKLYQAPNIVHNIHTAAQQIAQWEEKKPDEQTHEVTLTFRYGPYKDQIIKYSKLPHVPVMSLQGDSGGPVLMCDGGIYYLVGVIFAGSRDYSEDKEEHIKPEQKHCEKSGCDWAKNYEKEELTKFLPALKSQEHQASLVNNLKYLLPRLQQKIVTLTPQTPLRANF